MRLTRAERWSSAICLAESQRGVIVRRQLRSVGIPAREEARLMSAGWLREIRSGAYAIGGRPASPWDDAVAVSLLGGPGTVLSHATAAAIHRFPGLVPPVVPEVSVELPRHPRPQGVVLHRVTRLDPLDVEERKGVRLTTAARTVCDLAGRLETHLLARIVDEGCVDRRWTAEQLATTATRAGFRGRPGSRRLCDLLDVRTAEPEVESVLEQRVVRALAPYAPFVTQYQLVLDGQVLILDIAWPPWRVGAEVDGWTVRSRSFGKFSRGRHRDNLLLAHGWKVAHLTADMDQATILRDVGRLFPPEAVGVLAGLAGGR
jgi:hypothetical protein